MPCIAASSFNLFILNYLLRPFNDNMMEEKEHFISKDNIYYYYCIYYNYCDYNYLLYLQSINKVQSLYNFFSSSSLFINYSYISNKLVSGNIS